MLLFFCFSVGLLHRGIRGAEIHLFLHSFESALIVGYVSFLLIFVLSLFVVAGARISATFGIEIPHTAFFDFNLHYACDSFELRTAFSILSIASSSQTLARVLPVSSLDLAIYL